MNPHVQMYAQLWEMDVSLEKQPIPIKTVFRNLLYVMKDVLSAAAIDHLVFSLNKLMHFKLKNSSFIKRMKKH